MAIHWNPDLTAALAGELDAALSGAKAAGVTMDGATRRVLLHTDRGTLALELHPMEGWISLLPASEPLPEARPLRARVEAVRPLPNENILVIELPRAKGRAPSGTEDLELVVELLANRWNAILVERTSRAIREVLVERPGGKRPLVSGVPYEPPPPPPGREGVAAPPSVLAALADDRARSADAVPLAALLLSPSLVEELRDRARKARRKAAALQRQLDGTEDPAAVRSLGDLLLARLASVPRGRESVVLEGFDGVAVEVALDPELSPHENADRYYREAARVEKVRRALPGRIEAAGREAERWERLLDGVTRGDPAAVAEAGAIASQSAGAPPDGKRGTRSAGAPRGAGATGKALPYLRFTSSGGHEIRVGRSATRNEELTLHHSSPDDVWLHARQSPGAHVVLRWNRKENPPQRDLTEAAVLAALHSEARHAGTVAVDWTRRKYVRKPRKARPGSVVVERAQTVFVTPDPAVAERLAATE